MLNWSDPVRALPADGDYAGLLLPYWTWVEAYTRPMRGDALAAGPWKEAIALLNRPLPASAEPAAVSAQWRAFVAGVWAMRDGWVARQAVAAWAARARQAVAG